MKHLLSGAPETAQGKSLSREGTARVQWWHCMGAWLAPRHGFVEAAESGGARGHSHWRAAGCGVVLRQVEVRDAARQLRRQAAQVAGAAVTGQNEHAASPEAAHSKQEPSTATTQR